MPVDADSGEPDNCGPKEVDPEDPGGPGSPPDEPPGGRGAGHDTCSPQMGGDTCYCQPGQCCYSELHFCRCDYCPGEAPLDYRPTNVIARVHQPTVDAAEGQVFVTWNTAPFAAQYKIWRNTGANGALVHHATVSTHLYYTESNFRIRDWPAYRVWVSAFLDSWESPIVEATKTGGPVCGDGRCEQPEDHTICPQDCTPLCSDGQVEEREVGVCCQDPHGMFAGEIETSTCIDGRWRTSISCDGPPPYPSCSGGPGDPPPPL
ncbi:MAG: hypothetical protein AAF735_06355 [Myxococcota bacterium]